METLAYVAGNDALAVVVRAVVMDAEAFALEAAAFIPEVATFVTDGGLLVAMARTFAEIADDLIG